MATFDDKQWLLSHIHNSYITSDDTGLCEVVVQVEPHAAPVVDFPCLADDSPTDSNDDGQPHSSDIASDMIFGGPRQRSYTALRLEKMKKEEKMAARIKRVSWKHNSSAPICESELNELFSRKTVIDSSSKNNSSHLPQTSLLSHLLNQFPDGPDNTFAEFARYDGMTHTNFPNRRIRIFLLVGDHPEVDYPMDVCVLCSARVYDLIGLVCWLYTKERREPPLMGEVDHYALHIAEEDGQVDSDFHALPQKDCIDKYGFHILALMQKRIIPTQSSKDLVVTLTVAGGAFSKIQVESADITLNEILSRAISKRKEMKKIIDSGGQYHLEKEDDPGVSLDGEKTLAQVNCNEFAIVRDNSKRTVNQHTEYNISSSVCATHYQSYKVIWLLKFGKCEADLGISGEQFEIHPIQAKMGGSILPRRTPGPITYNMELVVDCTHKLAKKRKMEIEVTCKGENRFKDYLFECETQVGQDILNKVKHIFNLRTSSVRKEFLKEKKPFKRHNSLSTRRRPPPENHIKEI